MFPIFHFLSSLVLTIILYPFFGVWSLAVFIGGFLIDVDHYFYWAMKNRSLDPIASYKSQTIESKRNKERFKKIKKRPLYLRWDRLHIFHVWEFWVLMFLLVFVHKFFLINFLGMVLHLSLDFIDLFKDRVYGRRAVSFFCWLKRNKIRR